MQVGWIRRWTWLAAALTGCSPAIDGVSDDSAGTEGSEPDRESDSGAASSSTTAPDDGDSAETDPAPGGSPLAPDEQLCVDFCLARERCGVGGEDCYLSCLNLIDSQEAQGCGDTWREVMACEATEPLDAACRNEEACRSEYLEQDFCRGYCSYFDGTPGQSARQDSCSWRSSCFGGDVELYMECPVGEASGPCECFVDEALVGTCEAGIALTPFDCGDEAIHVLSGCCQPFFREVIR